MIVQEQWEALEVLKQEHGMVKLTFLTSLLSTELCLVLIFLTPGNLYVEISLHLKKKKNLGILAKFIEGHVHVLITFRFLELSIVPGKSVGSW